MEAAVAGRTIAAWGMGVLTRLLAKPVNYCVVVVLMILWVLPLDTVASQPVQLLLGLGATCVLVIALLGVAPEQRVRVVLVVVAATAGEVIASLAWGLYTYRLHNIPAYIPAGHGMLYLFGLRFSQLGAVRRHLNATKALAIVAITAWVLAGLLTGPDIGGALAAPGLVYVILCRRRSAPLFCGVLFIVALVEFYGTALGTWQWTDHARWWIEVPLGNPPSGVASGYILIELASILTAPYLFAACVKRARLARTLMFASQLGDIQGLRSRQHLLERAASAWLRKPVFWIALVLAALLLGLPIVLPVGAIGG